jgi:hypothetical protein
MRLVVVDRVGGGVLCDDEHDARRINTKQLPPTPRRRHQDGCSFGSPNEPPFSGERPSKARERVRCNGMLGDAGIIYL